MAIYCLRWLYLSMCPENESWSFPGVRLIFFRVDYQHSAASPSTNASAGARDRVSGRRMTEPLRKVRRGSCLQTGAAGLNAPFLDSIPSLDFFSWRPGGLAPCGTEDKRMQGTDPVLVCVWLEGGEGASTGGQGCSPVGDCGEGSQVPLFKPGSCLKMRG